MEKLIQNIILVLTALGIIGVAAIIFAYPVMLLWNWLMPEIFGLCTINFWQTFGIIFLSNALFKGSSGVSVKD